MIFSSFLCLWVFAGLAVSLKHTQFRFQVESDVAEDQFENHYNEPGFDLDLDAIRLVQFSLYEEGVWMTEREKLRAKAMGIKYLDITDAPSNFAPKLYDCARYLPISFDPKRFGGIGSNHGAGCAL
ncbi:hypothetical protein B0H10DRAFT_2203331 [Mycena sp. CBHHK59/15]|nr:hypothetical protein B0H10DRAFT_2203331 [Mycena sp. CBHHK59/15]